MTNWNKKETKRQQWVWSTRLVVAGEWVILGQAHRWVWDCSGWIVPDLNMDQPNLSKAAMHRLMSAKVTLNHETTFATLASGFMAPSTCFWTKSPSFASQHPTKYPTEFPKVNGQNPTQNTQTGTQHVRTGPTRPGCPQHIQNGTSRTQKTFELRKSAKSTVKVYWLMDGHNFPAQRQAIKKIILNRQRDGKWTDRWHS